MITVKSFDHLALRVRDIERALGFYRDILGLPVLFLEEVRRGQRPFVSLRIGNQLLDLVPDPTYAPGDRPVGGLLHFCITLSPLDFTTLITELRKGGVEVIGEPTRRTGAGGDALSVYVRDPDGHVVELKEHVDRR